MRENLKTVLSQIPHYTVVNCMVIVLYCVVATVGVFYTS